MKKQFAVLAAGTILVVAAQNSSAASAPPITFDPIIILSSSCSAGITVAGQDFGTWPTTTGNLTNQSAGKIDITCSIGQAYKILVNGGLYPDAVAELRKMRGGNAANEIPYRLYKGPGTSIKVGDTDPYGGYTPTAWDLGITATGDGNKQSYDLTANVYISMSPRAVDDYNDQVAVTIQLP